VAALLSVHYPIIPLITTSGNTEQTQGIPEKATQTFKIGVCVQLNGGFTQQWDGATYTQGIVGVSLSPGANLASNGLGAPGPFGQITGPGAIQTYGSVPNQPNAVNIAIATPMVDGRTLVALANSDTIFEIQCDASTGATYALTQANIGTQYGITIDAGGTMYLDIGKTTVGTNTCCQVLRLNPYDTGNNNRAQIVFTSPQLFP
jgi:hypothetical protein